MEFKKRMIWMTVFLVIGFLLGLFYFTSGDSVEDESIESVGSTLGSWSLPILIVIGGLYVGWRLFPSKKKSISPRESSKKD